MHDPYGERGRLPLPTCALPSKNGRAPFETAPKITKPEPFFSGETPGVRISLSDHRGDAALLLEAQKLLRQLVQSLGHDAPESMISASDHAQNVCSYMFSDEKENYDLKLSNKPPENYLNHGYYAY